ncbi:MAG: recombination regulator RecX [Victivallaceae bacterium]|nr:recombination regulator RecX [Victivallaceae bacterium]
MRAPLTAYERALRILDRRACTEQELRQRLAKDGFPAVEIDDAVGNCIRHGFVNDEQMTADCCETLVQRGNGPRMIKMKLQRRGLSPEDIDSVLEESKEALHEACRAAAETKLRTLRREIDQRAKRDKLFRFLAGRGFDSELVQQVVSETIGQG